MPELTMDDIRERSQELNDAQEEWEEMLAAYSPTVACHECGGNGQVYAGSLGSTCPRCHGQRVLAAPGVEQPESPPFAELRGRITAYGDALAMDKELPPVNTVPTLKEIKALGAQVKDTAKQLMAAQPKRAELGPAAAEPTEHDVDRYDGGDIDDTDFGEGA